MAKERARGFEPLTSSLASGIVDGRRVGPKYSVFPAIIIA
jgi:hypothetical protein